MKKGFQKKLQILLMKVSLPALVAIVLCVAIGLSITLNFLVNGNRKHFQKLKAISTEELQQQSIEQLLTLAKDKAEIADILILMSQKQTLLVAENMTDILENSDYYLKGYDESKLPDLWCNSQDAFQFSIHVRCPKEWLVTDSLEYGKAYNQQGEVLEENRLIKAQIAGEKNTGVYTVNEELYLGSLLKTSLSHIKHSKNADGNNIGLSASYFCYEDSGIDILADLETQQMIEYDGRNSGWYTSVKEAYEAGSLKAGQVFWTEPVLDGAGRGISVICASPVEVNGKFVGVAGTGGALVSFSDLVANSKVGDTGYSFMVNRENGKVILNSNVYQEKNSEVQIESYLSESENPELRLLTENICNAKSEIKSCTIDGKKVFIGYAPLKHINWSMVTVIEQNDPSIVESVTRLQDEMQIISTRSVEMVSKLVWFIVIMLFFIIVMSTLVILYSSRRFSANFTRPIVVLKEGAQIISSGNLEHRIEIDSNDEIQELGEAFNQMAIGLKAYIENMSEVMAEKERIGTELKVATQIQANMLPRSFPAFPEKEEFDIFAIMNPAKEVGGDFYDFFLVDDNHLAIVIADVSGKGVPAALFMVITRTLLKNHMQRGETPKEAFEGTNNQLCEGNETGLFVTAWLGVLEISTGIMTCVNAGHEAPLVKGEDGTFHYINAESGFVLAGLEDMEYEEYQISLQIGDVLYLYTDGVSEATNKNEELYGKERLLECLNCHTECEPQMLLKKIREDIDSFVETEPQFDDITMLALKIRKRKAVGETKKKVLEKNICVDAQIEQIPIVIDKINKILKEHQVLENTQYLIDIAADEIMSNIVYYSNSTFMDLRLFITDEQIKIIFVDNGMFYNPLENEAPDVEATAEERKIGGLGIFMVKELMDSVSYRNEDGKNMLTIVKNL